MTKQRLHHFDVIKGIAILIVVMGHVMIFGIHKIDSAFIFKLTERLHMPLFFFISGYFTYKYADGKIKSPNLISRFKQLIIPFFCVSTLWIYYFPHSGIESPLNSTWQGLYTDYWKNGYWFTLCLFELMLIYYVLNPLLNKLKKTRIQICLILLIYAIIGVITRIGNPLINALLGMPLIFQFMPIFFVGVLAKKYNDEFKKLITSNIAITFAILIGGFLIYFTCYYWEFPAVPHLVVEIATSILHIAVILIAFAIIEPWCRSEFSNDSPNKLIRALQYIGKESLAIYLIHYFFLFPLTSLRQPMTDMGLQFVPLFVVSLVVSCVIIAISLGVKTIIEKSKILSLLLLGKG